jgi:hypothetical protein
MLMAGSEDIGKPFPGFLEPGKAHPGRHSGANGEKPEVAPRHPFAKDQQIAGLLNNEGKGIKI